MVNHYVVKFDGSCWPNPGGTAAYGFILYLNDVEVERGDGVIGTGKQYSNNFAEHYALSMGLKAVLNRHTDIKSHVSIIGDSLLIINHVTGKHKGHDNMLYYPAYKKNMDLIKEIKQRGYTVSAKWVRREQNQECDDLSKLYKTK